MPLNKTEDTGNWKRKH